MKNTIHQAHDKLFKYSLSKKRIAVSFLKSRLPQAIYQRINIATLRLTDKSFVLAEFREIHSDIVYQCQINEKEAFIFFILEHESTANDELMAFRQLQYTVSAMDQCLRQGYKRLPIILPMCVYHGDKSPYPHSQDVYDYFEVPELARQIVFKPFLLIDLTVLSDEELSKDGPAYLMEMLLKHSRAKNFLTILNEQLKSIQLILNLLGKEYRRFVIKYMVNETQDESPEAIRQLIQKLNTIFPEEKKTIMTFADQLRQEGHKEGHKEGQKAEDFVIAERMLARGYSLEEIKKITLLSEQDLLRFEACE